MLRVLQINAGSQNFGGVSAILLNLYRNIDRSRVQFDFLTPNKTTYAMQREEIEAMGGHIYELGINSSNLPGKARLYAALREFFRDHHYDIVHVNAGVLLFNCFAASAAHRFTRSKIFVHSHSNGGRNGAKEKLSEPLKAFLSKRADQTLACSESAADYMFTKEKAAHTVILKNGISPERFAFSGEVRRQMRESLGLSEAFVIGCVARFSPEKNHMLMLDTLAEVQKTRPEARLLLVGGGELMESVRERAKTLGLEDSVIFAGQQADPVPYYHAMDVFILPSSFEGFGMGCLEAEASGLPVVTSDRVPVDSDVAKVMQQLPLEAGAAAFAGAVLNAKAGPRQEAWQLVREAGFDIASSAATLLSLYESSADKSTRKKTGGE